MKKQLFALALTTLLVGCTKNNQQIQVSDNKFCYAAPCKEAIPALAEAVVTQTVVSKTINFEKIGKEPENYTQKQVYHLTYDESGNFTSDIPYAATFEPWAMDAEAAYAMRDQYAWTFYLNPMRIYHEEASNPHISSGFSIATINILDCTFNDYGWSSKITNCLKTRFVDIITKNSGERIVTETLTFAYTYAQ